MTSITLLWLGTAGFLLEYQGNKLLLDPFFSRPPGAHPTLRARPEEFRAASLILVSHGHFDHAMDVATLALLSNAHVYAPSKTCAILKQRGVDPSLLHANEEHPSFRWHGVLIQVVPSRHIRFDGPLIMKTLAKMISGGTFLKIARLAMEYPLGSTSDFFFDFQGYRVLFSGSGGGEWTRLASLKPDCFLLPFAGRSDLIDYYLRGLRIIMPNTVVLHHFDTFFPSFCVEYPVEEFKRTVERELPGIRVIIPEMEVRFSLP